MHRGGFSVPAIATGQVDQANLSRSSVRRIDARVAATGGLRYLD